MDKYLSLFEEILKQAENPHSGLGLEMASFEGYSKENIDKFLIDMLGVSGEETKNLRTIFIRICIRKDLIKPACSDKF